MLNKRLAEAVAFGDLSLLASWFQRRRQPTDRLLPFVSFAFAEVLSYVFNWRYSRPSLVLQWLFGAIKQSLHLSALRVGPGNLG